MPVPAVVPVEPDVPVLPDMPVVPVLPVKPVLPVAPVAEVESTLTESVDAVPAAFCLHDAIVIPAQMHMPNANFFMSGFLLFPLITIKFLYCLKYFEMINKIRMMVCRQLLNVEYRQVSSSMII